MRTTLWTVPLATALLVGCGPAQPPPGDPTDQDPPPVTEPTTDPAPADPAAVVEPVTPDPAALQALLQEKCARCHGLDKVDAQRTDHAGWTAIVDRMIGVGAVLTNAERTDLIEYLATRAPS